MERNTAELEITDEGTKGVLRFNWHMDGDYIVHEITGRTWPSIMEQANRLLENHGGFVKRWEGAFGDGSYKTALDARP